MKVIILAGGMGSRLGSIADLIPKPMIEIGGKPILWHIMKIYSHYGFKDFIICLGYKGNVIKDYFSKFNHYNSDFTVDLRSGNLHFENCPYEDWQVTLADTGLNTLKGGRIKRIEKYIDSDINMLTYGDGVADINIDELVKFHKGHGKLITISGVKPPSLFGEILEKGGKVISFEEKPQTSKGLINGGYMVFNRKLLEYLTPDPDCDFEFGPLEKLAREGQVMTYKHDGFWECADTVRDVENLNKLWEMGKAFWKKW
ncbi:MAG: glucose-1-phosphate cytidylyltransferase [Desulfobacterales bacterium]|nr:glucose-1-phosphate cytidylyltransferase [Desulfobacterales bacterium]